MKQQGGQKVNAIGKYLYKHIDGAYKISFSPNTCDVYMLMYYQQDGQDLQEMHFDLSITTYQNKVRINTTEVTKLEKTIGQDIYSPDKLEDMNKAFSTIYSKITRHIAKEYKDYDFIF